MRALTLTVVMEISFTVRISDAYWSLGGLRIASFTQDNAWDEGGWVYWLKVEEGLHR